MPPENRRASDDEDSPFANVREVHALEGRLTRAFTKAVTGLESRLTTSFREILHESDRTHEAEHAEMRRVGNERHGPLNDLILRLQRQDEEDAIERARRQGARAMLLNLWRLIAVLDTHWRVVLLVVALLLALFGAVPHISITTGPSGSPGPT